MFSKRMIFMPSHTKIIMGLILSALTAFLMIVGAVVYFLFWY